MTDAERLLWRHLRMKQLGTYRFRRQVPVAGYIVDFLCVESALAIEVDGGQHVSNESRDAKRSSELEKQGLRVLRFWNNNVLTDIESVKAVIWQALMAGNHPHPNLPPEGEGEQSA
jgi:very-short-patch-repair endonuclease